MKFCLNLPRPLGKAKYSHVTDSEIEPETVCLQAVRVQLAERWRAFCIMSQRVSRMLLG